MSITFENGYSVYKVTSALYDFSTFVFTNAGATGPYGPSQQSLLTYYTASATWAANNQFFTSSGRGVQEWTVPETATYRITAAGAAGGNSSTLTGTAATGGWGALIETDVQLTQGSKIAIVVGQMGGDRVPGGTSNLNAAAGGGGTFVYDSSSLTYYVAAGGGGGAAGSTTNLYTNQTTASGKWNTTTGSLVVIGNSVGSYFFASGGFSGNGGYISTRGTLYGPPGAGINSTGSFANHGNGQSRLGGWLGGGVNTRSCFVSNVRCNVSGGFGGGGGAVWGDNSYAAAMAGGGGGYSGGGGGGNSGQANSSHGGGGGSYYIGSLISGSSGANPSHGYVKITKL